MRLRDRGGPLPSALLLVYPIVHAELPTLSDELTRRTAILPARSMFPPEAVRAMNLNYVRDPVLLREAYAFPGGHDLSGLPPTLVLNADVDTLRASGERFAAELAGAGVDVTVLRENGTWHGYLNDPSNPAAGRSIDRIAAWLARPTTH